jgi:acyl-CoA reductase-like NAD-dependent aldehyde dehydrogenase
MPEEILGHILPIMTYADITEVPDKIEPRDNSLAMCRFGKDKSKQPYLLSDVQSDRIVSMILGFIMRKRVCPFLYPLNNSAFF